MKKNIGTVDKAIRILLTITIAGLYLTHLISGTVAIVLLVLAIILVVTSFVGICPLYLPFGLSTRKKGS